MTSKYLAKRKINRAIAPEGKPRKYKTREELQKVVDDYFNTNDSRLKTFVDKDGNETTALVPAPYTISGLARAIGLDRAQIIEYGNNQEYYNVIKDARLRCQADVERRLLETSNQAGAIFWLKNNAGWRDEQIIDSTNRTETTVIYRPEKLPETTEGEIIDKPQLR
jgi:hypothetical protein